MTTMTELTAARIVPVVVTDDVGQSGDLADALVAGGLAVAEVTLRTPSAIESIAEMSRRRDILIGAGTVRTPEAVDRAVEAGARFIVSPGLRADVVGRAQSLGVPVVPGCVTPTEIMAAQELGLSTVKFFPAAQYGGPSTLSALAGPFPDIGFIPTGGVSEANLADYLRLPGVVAVGGSWMVGPAAHGDLDEVVRRCRAAVLRAQEVS